MKFFDLHVHTTFCDGVASPREMVEAALALGCPRIGFSAHAPYSYPSYAMKKSDEPAYRAEIATLREEYRERIEVLCGLELDLHSLPVEYPYDYIIGSVHSLSPEDENGRRTDVDGPYDRLCAAIERDFGGDPYAAVEDYFASVARLAERRPDIIGHFDLIRKHNRDNRLFDETAPRYLAAAYAAVDALLPLGVPFEVNTGGIARGYRETPYPAAPILAYILSNGGKVILTGDAHRPENLCFQFARWAEYVKMFR
jgi:histidinol-phosphatase (PHP family)